MYHRQIDNVQLVVEIDDDLFAESEKIFDSLFSSFSVFTPLSNKGIKKIRIFHHLNYKGINNKDLYDYYIICNPNEDNWAALLIDFLEYCFQSVFKCTVLHGSCLSINGLGVLVLGNRKCGKSTLTRFLTNYKNVLFLDDDSVYVQRESIIGFGFPIRLRNVTQNDHTIIDVFFDGEDQRYICDVNHVKKTYEVNNVSLVIFPEYNKESGFSIESIFGSDLINYAIHNLKDSPSLYKSFKDISSLLKNVKAFQIKYNNCEMVGEFIMDFLNVDAF